MFFVLSYYRAFVIRSIGITTMVVTAGTLGAATVQDFQSPRRLHVELWRRLVDDFGADFNLGKFGMIGLAFKIAAVEFGEHLIARAFGADAQVLAALKGVDYLDQSFFGNPKTLAGHVDRDGHSVVLGTVIPLGQRLFVSIIQVAIAFPEPIHRFAVPHWL